MRGRKPSPTALKILTGNPGGRRLNMHEPQVDPELPEAPEHLNADAKVGWDRVTRQLYDSRIVSKLDAASLAAYCMAYARWVQAERAIAEMAKRDQLTGGLIIKTSNGNAVQNPLVGTATKAAGDVIRYAAEFGMTPSARARLVVNPDMRGSARFAGLLGPGWKPWEVDPADEFFSS